MGYQTDYTLDITHLRGEEIDKKEVIYKLKEASPHDARYSLNDDGSCSGNDSRWYEHESEFKAFSQEYPDLLFTLSGEGEEAGDIWTKYFVDGKMQEEKLNWQPPPFDPAKLK